MHIGKDELTLSSNSPDNDITDLSRATFRATFPPIQSAIKIYGNGDGVRIQFDVPESEMGEAVKLLAMRGKVLRVVVSVEPQHDRFG